MQTNPENRKNQVNYAAKKTEIEFFHKDFFSRTKYEKQIKWIVMQTGISIQHRGSFVYLDYNYTCTNTYQKIKGCGGNFRFILSSFNKIFSINFENLCIIFQQKKIS